MFTGIVEKSVALIGVAEGPGFRRLTLAPGWTDAKLGESIAVNGVCLTIAEINPGSPGLSDSPGHPGPGSPAELGFDVIAETLRKTNLGLLHAGDKVHLERALRVGDRFDGHFVQGHVDGTAALIEQVSKGDEFRLRLQAPPHLVKYLVPQGSVTIDGVSLTLAAIDGPYFEVALIPTTLQLTSLGDRPLGWPFNLEADVVSKTIVTHLERMNLPGGPTAGTGSR